MNTPRWLWLLRRVVGAVLVWATLLAATPVTSVAQPPATSGVPATSMEAQQVAEIETLAQTDRAAAQARARPARDAVDEAAARAREAGETSARQARELRQLAQSARESARANNERAERALRDSRDTRLSDQSRAELVRHAESFRRAAGEDLQQAGERDARAAALQRDAERYHDRAAELAALLERLQAVIAAPGRPEPATSAPPTAGPGDVPGQSPLKFAAVYDVLGMWRPATEPRWPFVIVQQNPGDPVYPHRIEAHTESRVWKGEYTSFDAGHPARRQNARVVFRYKPTADEINAEVPDWARRMVQGKLEWRLELDETGTEGDPRFSMKWFPGEIRWSDGGGGPRTAEVVGDGLPRVTELEPEDALTIEELSQVVLGIQLHGGNHDPDLDPIEALLKGQPFFVRVSVPAQLAKSQGPTLTVTIRNLKGGSETLELTGSPSGGLRPVIYSHLEAVTINDCNMFAAPAREPQFMSYSWIFGIKGDCLNLSVGNGDTVEFRFGEATQQVTMYGSWVQRGLARHEQGVGRLRVILEAIAQGDHGAAQKAAARQRLRMLDNYSALIASPRLTDVHRFYVGELYFGERDQTLVTLVGAEHITHAYASLIFLTDEQLRDRARQAQQSVRAPDNPSYFNPVMKAFLEGLTGKDLSPRATEAGRAVAWTSDAEQQLVIKALRETSDEQASGAIRGYATSLAFGMYDGFMTATRVGRVYLVATGQDHFKRSVPTWLRLHAAIGLATDAAISLAGSTAFQRFATRSPGVRLGAVAKRESTLLARGRRGVEHIEGTRSAPDLPKSLNEAKRQQASLPLRGEPDGAGGPGCVDGPTVSGRPAFLRDATSAPGATPGQLRYIERFYGKEARIIREGVFPEIQTGQTCNPMAVAYPIQKNLKRTIREADSMKALQDIMRAEVAAGRMSAARYAASHNGPYPNWAIRRYLRSLGATVAENPVVTNSQLKLRHIWSALERGYEVKIILDFGVGYHAVNVTAVRANPRTGTVNALRIFDPNLGGIIEVPAQTFRDRIARVAPGQNAYGVLTVFKW